MGDVRFAIDPLSFLATMGLDAHKRPDMACGLRIPCYQFAHG